MALGEGTGRTYIELILNDRVTPHLNYTMEYFDHLEMIQVFGDRILDTDEVLVMDDGSTKQIIKGYRAHIVLAVHWVRECHDFFPWKTFMYELQNWDEEIRITPHVDAPLDIYWVRKIGGWDLSKDIHYDRFRGTMEFEGVELISSI